MVLRIGSFHFFLFVFLFLSACGGSTAMRSNKPAQAVDLQPPQQKTLVAGADHFFVLQDGEFTGWGSNYGGKVTAPDATDIRMVSAGFNHSLALTEDGRVLSFGDGSRKQALKVPKDLEGVVQVVAAQDTSVAVLENGSLAMWGFYYRPPSLGEGVIEVEAGYIHFLAKLNDGRVLAWGHNDQGQVRLPTGVTDEHAVVEIAAGEYHNVVLRADGSVLAWGDNTHGQCDVPEFDQPVVDVEATNGSSLALLADGTLVTWGEPLPQAAPDNIIELEANYDQVLLRTSDGAVHHITSGRRLNLAALNNAAATSGDLVLNSSGEVLPVFMDTPEIPTDLPPGIVKIKGRDFPYSERNYFASSPHGFGSSTQPLLPRANADYWDDRVRQVNMVLSNTGELVLWGDNRFGQLDMPLLEQPVKDADCGAWHCLAVLDDGEVMAWGRNLSGQTDVPDELDGVVAVQAGASFSMALIDDGSVVIWGGNYRHELELPEFNERVVDIFADEYSAGVILADGSGTVWRDGAVIELTGHSIGSGLQNLIFDAHRVWAVNAESEVSSWSERGYEQTLVSEEAATHLIGYNGIYTQVAQDGSLSMWGGYRIPANLVEVLKP